MKNTKPKTMHLNPDLYYVTKSFADDRALYDAVCDDVGGHIGLVDAAMGIATQFLSMCELHVNFDEYAEGCFGYEMESAFASAFVALRGGYDDITLDEGYFPSLNESEFITLCEKLKLPLKTAKPKKPEFVWQVIEWDADGPNVVTGRYATREEAQAHIHDSPSSNTRMLAKYRVLPDDTVEHVQDYLLDGTPVALDFREPKKVS